MKYWSFKQRHLPESYGLNLAAAKVKKPADELIGNPAQIYKEIHQALGIKERRADSLTNHWEEPLPVWDKVISANCKIEAMYSSIDGFFVDYYRDKVFTKEELDSLKKTIAKDDDLSAKLTVFARAIGDKLAEYFDRADALDKMISRAFNEDKNFFGGIQNQIATTVSLSSIAIKQIKDKLEKSLLKFEDKEKRDQTIMKVIRNLDQTLYGFAKTQMQALFKLFNVLGHKASMPPKGYLYDFKPGYFDFDDQENPSTLLPKRKLIKDLKFWTKLFPFFRQGKKFMLLPKKLLAFGCPALAVKAPNGDNFIKLIHEFICDSFEATVLPSLDQIIRL